ncbi:hypothetical protein GCM10017691_61470 [Pseudonocardia petroleophila]|uniref:STAS domain-containing protein n=1 Tax=Pseudonocardia petroleophila TaxID=37331 RepID=A0A7G7MM66_9PSEU|nr:STAS domain-containing protein [Pseudonocardia petroleophila]QNG53877.1 STAS domain-containing protein [Pseudonocardia petroleophila]
MTGFSPASPQRPSSQRPSSQRRCLFDVAASGVDGRFDVVPAGELDAACADRFRGVLHECAAAGAALVVVDLAGLRLLSAAGVAVLVDAREVLDACGARLVLTRATRAATRVLRLTGLDVLLGDPGDADPVPRPRPGRVAAGPERA